MKIRHEKGMGLQTCVVLIEEWRLDLAISPAHERAGRRNARGTHRI